MKDVQKEKDIRNIAINKVGIKNLYYPITISDKKDKLQKTIAKVNMYVDLPSSSKGTHMSRFVEILHKSHKEISYKSLSEILAKIKKNLGALSSYLEFEFPYFINKIAPKSKTRSLMKYKCRFMAKSDDKDKINIKLGIDVPVLSLCPCSKEISNLNAHNQRCIVSVILKLNNFIWIEDLVKTIEKCASAELYSALKRVDEKQITENSFENPKFVEDIVRDVAIALKKYPKIKSFCVSAESFESIHNHNAYAYIKSTPD